MDKIVLITTEGCNIRCKYCYQHKSKINFISEETQNSLLKFINKYQTRRIDLFGGEPLNPENTVKLLEFLKKIKASADHDIVFSVTSNLYEFDENTWNIFKYVEDNFEWQHIQISLDGVSGEDLRVNKYGESTREQVIKNLNTLTELFKEHYNKIPPIHIHSVLTQTTIYKLDGIVDFADATIHKIGVRGDHAGYGKEFNIDELTKAFKHNYNRYLNGEISIKALRSFAEIKSYEQGMKTCSCGSEYNSFLPNGDQIACHMYVGCSKDAIIGNINDNTFNPSYTRKYDNKTRILSSMQSGLTGEDCAFCPAQKICYVCKAGNFRENKDPSVQCKSMCSWFKSLWQAWFDIIFVRAIDVIPKAEYKDWKNTKAKLEEEYKQTKSKDVLYKLRFLYLLLISDQHIDYEDAEY